MARTRVRPSALTLLASIGLLAAVAGCVTEVDLLGSEQGSGVDGVGANHFLELFADDPLRRTADLENGVYGSILQDGEIRNQNSQLDFGGYHDGEFTVGIQGSERGFIVDLGEDEALGAALTATAGSGFGALKLASSGFAYAPADAVFDDGTVDHAPVAQAHVYVIRLSRDGEPDLVWKAIVADVASPNRAALDWTRLR